MSDSFSEMRRRNALRVLDLIREHGELSRADLARLTDLSKATISSITTELLDSNLVRETGSLSTEKGRRPVGLVFNPGGKVAVGLSLDQNAGTATVADMDGKLLAGTTFEYNGNLTAEHLAEQVSVALDKANVPMERLMVVGLAAPAPLAESKYHLLGKDMQALLHKQVAVETLVDMAAIAEAHAGKLPPHRLVLFVRASQQLRSTMVVGNKLMFIQGSVGGDPGHIIAPWIQDECGCGNVGCVNTHTAHQFVIRRASQAGLSAASIDEIVEACRAGSAEAVRIVEDAGRAAGFAIACLVNVLAPVTVIVSGRIAAAGEPYWSALQTSCRQYAVRDSFEASDILPSALGSDSAALGAALHALTKHSTLMIGNGNNGAEKQPQMIGGGDGGGG
jgi:predicted NBD/HSP70 family sugar kinase